MCHEEEGGEEWEEYEDMPVPKCIDACPDFDVMRDDKGELLDMVGDTMLRYCSLLNSTQCLAVCIIEDRAVLNPILEMCRLGTFPQPLKKRRIKPQ